MFITRRHPLFLFSPDEGGGGDAGQAPTVETPETPANTPEGTGTDQQQVQTNWEDRYKEAQAWGTRNAQRVAELETHEKLINAWNSEDPDAQRWAAEQLGIQLDEEPPDGAAGSQTDPQALARLEAIEQRFQTQEQQQVQEQQYTAYRADVDPQLKTMGVPDGLHELVAEAALQLPGLQTPQGLRPDLEGAVKQVEELVLAATDLPSVQSKVLEQYRKTKRAPAISSSGTAGTQVPNLDKRSDRVAHMVEQLRTSEM